MKKAVIIALIVLCAIGWVSLVTSKASESSEQKNYVEEADVFVEKGLYQRAIANYELALTEKASEEIYSKANNAYKLRYAEAPEDTFENYMVFLQNATNFYPANEEFVNAMVELYHIDSDYQGMYDCLMRAISNGYDNEDVQKNLKIAKYAYKIRGSEFTSIRFANGSYYSVGREMGCNLYNNADGYLWSKDFPLVTVPNEEGIAVAVGEDSRLIDATGMVMGIFEKNVSDAGIYSEGLIPACIDGKYGYYNEFAEFQFGEYEYAGTFQDGKAAVKKDGKWMLVDKKGESVSDSYLEIVLDMSGRYMVNEKVLVKTADNSYEILNAKMKKEASISCSDADILTKDGFIAVCINGLWGFVDEKGEEVIKAEYEMARSFSNGVAAVCKDGLWGFIDKENSVVIDYQFSDALYMDETGTCIVRTDIPKPVVEEETTDVAAVTARTVETEATTVLTTEVQVTEEVTEVQAVEGVTEVQTTEVQTTEVQTTEAQPTSPLEESTENTVENEEPECWQFLVLELGITEEKK